MTFFDEPKPAKRKRLGHWITFGITAIVAAGLLLIPTGFVIERPGQVFNVMGEVDGTRVISSKDVETFASDSEFDVTTVSLLGNRESTPSWVQVLYAWADPNQVVLPLDEVFPPSFTADQFRAESSMQMEVSQQDAIAVALKKLGYEVPRVMYVNTVLEGAPSASILIAGDIITAAGGVPVGTFDEFKAQIQLAKGTPLSIEVVRDGRDTTVLVTPALSGEAWAVGSMIGYTYDFPFEIDLQLGDVGGPSGGLIFSIGVLDSLTEGSLAGPAHVAGTGTIDSDGNVGPIGGIALKMLGAQQAGAELFLVPEANCQEAIHVIPSNLTVVSVRDLTEALEKIELFANGEQLPAMQCNN